MLEEYVHRFRNALVKASEIESYRLYELERWEELNSFPFGACDLASNFLAMYLKEKGIQAKVIWCSNELEKYSGINFHVWLEVDDKFIDITISQFPEYSQDRVYICRKKYPSILSDIYNHCRDLGHHNFQEREIQLETSSGGGGKLYEEIRNMADTEW
ncbi:hypothetical protein ACJJI3_00190 [Microbulbifer sp. ZKSA004]|uniref:hypothetical protein n=1 Tax=Microbulbifer sp. ZKSA004 TaxID=3243389 RepID=UPI00403A2D31